MLSIEDSPFTSKQGKAKKEIKMPAGCSGCYGLYAFWLSISIGILIGLGIYLLTLNVLASILLCLGIWGVVYFISVGLTVISHITASIEASLKSKER